MSEQITCTGSDMTCLALVYYVKQILYMCIWFRDDFVRFTLAMAEESFEKKN